MVTAIIQARMGSTRLPGKVLKSVEGATLLEYQIERVRRATCIEHIVVATSTSAGDGVLEQFCRSKGWSLFRGSEHDVLDRYYQCAERYGATPVVRLTADCPFVDPVIIDRTIQLFHDQGADYAANTVPPETSHFPDGMDVEVFSTAALARAHREATDLKDREHVTFYFWKGDHGFRTAQLSYPNDYSKYRVTVDYPEDIEVVAFLMRTLRSRGQFGHLEEVTRILDEFPEIRAKNGQYYFGIGWQQS